MEITEARGLEELKPKVKALKRPRRPRKQRKPQLTEGRKELLQLIVDYRSLTTKQVWRLAYPDRHYSHTSRELASLRELRMLASHPIEPELGRRSELAWVLLKRGADVVGIGNDYDSHQRRKPTKETMRQRDLELELKRQVEDIAGWNLIKPVTHSPAKPLPEPTRQARHLIVAASFAEYTAVQRLLKDDPHHPQLKERAMAYKAKMYEVNVPARANDYVAWLRGRSGAGPINNLNGTKAEIATVLILCEPRATERFWQTRIEEYRALAINLRVYGVFSNRDQAAPFLKALKNSGLRAMTLDQVGAKLVELTPD
jgi:hypothetical protein